jgi:prevent-host-death family protein
MYARVIGAAEFKARCLRLLEELGPEGLVVTKRGRPVARVVPFEPTLAAFDGVLAGRVEVLGDVLSTGLAWEAEAPDAAGTR